MMARRSVMTTTMMALLLAAVGLCCRAAPEGFNSDYCQADATVPSGSSSEAPSGYTLRFAQVITRHGDRLPTDTPAMAVNDSVVWECTLDNLGIPTVTDSGLTLPSPGRLYRLSYLPGRQTLPGNCMYGALTAKGAAQHEALGGNFARAYAQTNRLVAGYQDVWVRSTNLQRTVNSIQADLVGVFPIASSSGGAQEAIDIHSIDDATDNMTPNSQLCPRLNAVYQQQEATPQYQTWLQNQTILQTQIAALGYFGGKASSVSLGSFMDMCWCRQCHSFGLPAGVTQQLFEQVVELETYAKNNLFWGGKSSLPWAIGDFVGELRDNVAAFVQKGLAGVPAKLMFFSGHDSTIVPLANAFFRVNDLAWSPYASHIEIELWTDASNAFLVKTSYNGVDFVVPGCAGVFCPFPTWSDSVSWAVPSDFATQCQQTPPPLPGPSVTGPILHFDIPRHFFT